MDMHNTDNSDNTAEKIYKSIKIPGQNQFQGDGASNVLPQNKTYKSDSPDGAMFYEIEYTSSPFPGVGKLVLKSQKIEKPQYDEKRNIFNQMRDLARSYHFPYDSSRFYDQRVKNINARIFYKQGIFMKDFSDNFSESIQLAQYFPNYQMMGYKQLRTYFTWRTEVRKGNVTDISLSYAFLYIYELLSNIGVNDPEDGLNKLMSFWTDFRTYNNNKSIDKYVLRWLKDYHIYYQLPHSFKEFIHKNNLTEHYQGIVDADDNFDLFCSISKYNIKKSNFFTDDKAKLITDCFYFVIDRIRQIFIDNGISFDESIFKPTKKMSEWKPFKDALFYPWLKQADRQIVLSENEIYICTNNKWTFSTHITSENGRQLIGYIMKQMEVALRKITKYKYKLSANLDTVNHELINKLNKAGLSLEAIINNAVLDYYKEATKIVVSVDHEALSRIRKEALITQEKLIVPEEEDQLIPFIPVQETLDLSTMTMKDTASIQPKAEESPIKSPWDNLKNSLTDIEIKALDILFYDNSKLKKYADECGIMLEVLVDGINEKAMDFVGDNLIDEEFVLYDDYKEQVKELIR